MILFLFIRDKSDLASVCLSVSEFLSFRINNASQSGDILAGIWIHPEVIAMPPDTLSCMSPENKVEFLVKESFSLSGIWTLCSIEPVSSQQFNFLEISRDVMIKTLINLSEGMNKAKDGGYYAPIFSFNDCKDNVQDELKALQSQHGNRIAPPVFYDQRAGLISLQNSQNMTGGGNK